MQKLAIIIVIFNLLLIASCTEDPCTIPGNTEQFGNLNGSWIRVESNNPSADGMIVQIVSMHGVITDRAGSGFDVGDIKWQEIVPVDKENFMYEELGSDGNYYASAMELHSDDTLRIMVGSSGAGNQQKWVRDGEYIPGQGGPAVTEVLPGQISEDRTLKNGPAAIDYRINEVLDVTGTLIIEPGTVIEMGANAGIGVYDDGVFKAVGTESAPIIIRGTRDDRGWWRGIHIESGSVDNILRYVMIQDAGSNYVYCCNDVTTILLRRGGRASLENVHLKNGEGIGLIIERDVNLDKYKEIRIETHGDHPVSIHPEMLTSLDGLGSDYSGNDNDHVFVTDGAIQKVTTIDKLNVPYLVEGKVIDIQQQLTIRAGVDMMFEAGAGLGVYDDGALSVNGTSAEPVTMRGMNDEKGFWRGIHMETDDANNSLNYLNLSNAGSNYVYCCNDKASILFKRGTASIANCTISNGAGYGIIARADFAFANYDQNTITKHQQEPLQLSLKHSNELDGTASSYTGNDEDYILISDRMVNSEITIKAADIPYRIEASVVIDVTAQLNIMPGVDLAFSENAGLGVYDAGLLNAVGSPGKQIRFRGVDGTKGYWRGIHTETDGNRISYADILHAGSNYVYCCNVKAGLLVKAGDLNIDKSNISNNDGCGIYVSPGATLQESGNYFSNNSGGDVCD